VLGRYFCLSLTTANSGVFLEFSSFRGELVVVLAWELDNRTLITGFNQALEFGAISNTCQTMVCRGVVQVSVNAHISSLCTCKTMVFF
jgi:hypothetical protein